MPGFGIEPFDTTVILSGALNLQTNLWIGSDLTIQVEMLLPQAIMFIAHTTLRI